MRQSAADLGRGDLVGRPEDSRRRRTDCRPITGEPRTSPACFAPTDGQIERHDRRQGQILALRLDRQFLPDIVGAERKTACHRTRSVPSRLTKVAASLLAGERDVAFTSLKSIGPASRRFTKARSEARIVLPSANTRRKSSPPFGVVMPSIAYRSIPSGSSRPSLTSQLMAQDIVP